MCREGVKDKGRKQYICRGVGPKTHAIDNIVEPA